MTQPPAMPGAPEAPDLPDAVRSRRRVLGIAGALLLIGAGAVVGVVLARGGSSSVEPAALRSGWTRQTGPGFTLGLPPEWRSVPTTANAKDFEALEKSEPQLAALVRDQFGGQLSPFIRFIAFEVGTPLSQQFSTNLTVIVAAASGGLDGFIENDAAQLRQAEGVGSTIQEQRIELPAGEAGIVTAQLQIPGGSRLGAVTHYVLVRGENGYILQFTTLADQLTRLSPLFEEIARTFRFV